jgi:hypothetical protein
MAVMKSRAGATALMLTFALAGILLSAGAAISAGGRTLAGTLVFAPGKLIHSGGKYIGVGTYFRMLEPGGTQYFQNPDGPAKNLTYTLLRPGTNKGLELGAYQAPPKTAFSSTGNSLANRITQPQPFAAINFSISTAATDAQSHETVAAPTLRVKGTKITGNLSAWTAEWNKIYFNQGAPKPGGTYPGGTTPVTGTYNPKTKAFVVTWYSAIVGGPFNGFIGFWHLQGKLRAS